MSIDLIKNRYKEEITIRVKINDLDSIETKTIDIIGTLDKHLELKDESNNNI